MRNEVMTRRVSEPDLQLLLESGETLTIEFKERLPTPDVLARTIAAFANTEGGTVLVGIREDGTVVGTGKEEVIKRLELAKQKLLPVPRWHVHELYAKGQTVVAIDVEPTDEKPVLADGSALIRIDSTIGPATSSQILSLLKISPDASPSELSRQVAHLAEIIEKQSETIETLRKESLKAGSWGNKAQNWIIGGLIGAVIGMILGAIISMG